MTCFKESYLFRLLTLLLAAYQDSGLHRLALVQPPDRRKRHPPSPVPGRGRGPLLAGQPGL